MDQACTRPESGWIPFDSLDACADSSRRGIARRALLVWIGFHGFARTAELMAEVASNDDAERRAKAADAVRQCVDPLPATR